MLETVVTRLIFEMILFFSLSLILIYLKQVQPQDNIFEFSPNQPLCLGEEVNLTCYLFPDTQTYRDLALMSFNQSTPESAGTINIDRASIGYSTTIAIPIMGSSARIQLTIASFKESDGNTLFGCHAELTSDASVTTAIESGYPPIAAPPSTPSVTVSPTNCTHRVITWTAPATTDRYYVSRNSSLLSVATDTQYTDTDQLMLDTNYRYSVIASSCAGNSTEGTVTYSITGYALDTGVSLSISYDNTCYTSIIGVNWTLSANPGELPLPLTYSLILVYSYSQADMLYSYSDAFSFSLPSDVTTHSQMIAAPIFSTNASVIFSITACVSITEQCESSFVGDTVCGRYSAGNIPALTTATTTTTPPPVSTHPTNTPSPALSAQLLASLIILVIIILLGAVLSITIITILVVVIVVMYRKNKHLQSLCLPTQPPHPYEYIDLNTAVSADTAAIPSPHKDSAYYTAMHSAVSPPLSSQGAAPPPPTYANLK